MTSLLLFFSCGIVAASYLPFLPSFMFLAVMLFGLAISYVFLVTKFPIIKIFLAFMLGIAYGICAGYYYLSNQLSNELVGKELMVEGQVIELPEEDSRRQLFSLSVTQAYSAETNQKIYNDFPSTINLSSYDDLRVKAGERWQLLVKLKKPRGFVNPGGYDYQVSLLRKGVGAVGYVKPSSRNQLLQSQPPFSMNVLRYQLQQWLLQKSQSPEKGILVALLVGDTSEVDKEHWGEMLKTGTNHLIAISGLHLGFFAIVGFFMGNVIGRFVQLLWCKCPSMYIGYLFAIGFTVFYSIIAGLNIPTLRTLIMLAVVQWVLVWRRSFRGRDTLLLALVLVLLYDPLAAFDIGFWLSFGAVAILMFSFSGRIKPKHTTSLFLSAQNHFSIFIKSQWIMFIGLLIPLAVLVHSTTFLALPANFIAIPLVTFFVVPCLIFSAICHSISGNIAAVFEDIFLHCAEMGLEFLHQWLSYLVKLSAGNLTPLIAINPWALVVALLGVLLLLLPRGLGNKWLGVCALVVALIIPQKPLPDLQMMVFDVGQGTAILLRTPHHQLLYDTGPRYTENFDAGSALIVPYLQSQGLRHLDTVVVSHSDTDHSGGLAGVLAATQVDSLLLGEPEKYFPSVQESATSFFVQPTIDLCHHAQPWQWDQVSFRFITWPLVPSAKANNHSCVLLVEYQGHKILLTGDIEKEVERVLLEQNSLEHVDILLAPHHGSHSSSTQAFVEAISPNMVIYSAGYHNQHGHPHKDIVARYTSSNATAFNTAFSGALEFVWNHGDFSSVQEYRHRAQRYWFDGEKQ